MPKTSSMLCIQLIAAVLSLQLSTPIQASSTQPGITEFAKDKNDIRKNTKRISAQGTIRDAEALSDGPLFLIEYEHTSQNNLAVSTIIRQSDLSGKTIALENTLYDAKGKLKKYTLRQFQSDISASVEVIEGNVLMNWNEAGNSKSSTEAATENTVAAGSLMAYMSPQIETLSKGRTLNVRLAVPERGSVMGFEIAPRREGCQGVVSVLCVNLMLSNFFLQKLLKPIEMSFQKTSEGYRPLSLETPAVLRRVKGNKLEKFTARIDYPRL